MQYPPAFHADKQHFTSFPPGKSGNRHKKRNFLPGRTTPGNTSPFRRRLDRKKLELEIDLDAVDYYGNKDLLAHVWQNILSNAIKFAPENGIIHILLRRENGSLITSITDNGIGMSEDVMRRIFEKFYQGDFSRSSQGNGLGLALAKRIVDLHGGNISVSSKEGKGTTFTVSLPLTSNTKGYDT